MSNMLCCAHENSDSVRELEPQEIDAVSGAGLQWRNGRIIGFQFSAGNWSIGEMPIAGGTSYNYWSTPFGGGSFWGRSVAQPF